MAEKLSKEQVAEFKEAFDRFDKNKDGTISVQELGTVMQEVGLKPSEADLKVVISRLDTEENGSISFQEFLEAMAAWLQTSDMEGLREIFRVRNHQHLSGEGKWTPWTAAGNSEAWGTSPSRGVVSWRARSCWVG